MNKKLFAAASLSVVVSGGMWAQVSTAVQGTAPQVTQLKATTDLVKLDKSIKRVGSQVFSPEKGISGTHDYIVRFEEEPLATHRGSVVTGSTKLTGATLKTSQTNAKTPARLNAKTAESKAYVSYLKQRQADLETDMTNAIGRNLDVKHRYQTAINGMTVRLTQEEATRLASLPGIAKIQRDRIDQLATDRGPSYIEAPYLWGDTGSGLDFRGEGIVVGIMDSGINGDHPSFAEVSSDGYEHTNPLGDGVFLGICDPDSAVYDATIECNNKLIGRYAFLEGGGFTGDSEDTDGHGSHVASTAAGNPVPAPVFDAEGNPTGLDIAISGVAPRANIVALQVCGDVGCYTSDRLAALDQIIADGVVDVINHSIGSSIPDNTSPWEDAMELGWLSARAAGITVANSAGNNGPDPATLGSPSAPWVINSGAFTHDRAIETKFLESLSGGETVPPTDIEGRAVSGGVGPAPIVFAGDYVNGDVDPEQCLTPFPAGTWTNNEIVMCERGSIARVDKCINVRDGGAAGCILANTVGGASSLNNDAHVIPAIHIAAEDGEALKTWLASGSDHMGTITDNLVPFGSDPANGAIAGDFTSRGPNLSMDYLPISVGAPGVDIYAASANGIEYGFLSGTSMASPHSAGAAALLKQAHPEWTDAEILSALATTANYSGATKEDGETPADPFDVGGGVVLLSQAVNAGLLLDESVANFEAADPALGGDPKTLNVAGMVTRGCLVTCSWTRTVEATTAGTWTVATTSDYVTASPASFTLAAGEIQEITVEVDTAGLTDTWYHDLVVLTPASTDLPEQHLTVSFVPSTGEIPDLVEIVAHRDADSELIRGLTAPSITDLQAAVSGFVKPVTTVLSLTEDSDTSSPFDDLTDGVYYTTFDLDETATRLMAATSDDTSTAPDVDIYVGYDLDGNGMPGDGEIACISATASATEFCDLTGLFPGTWWVLVQVWQGSDTPPDSVELKTAVVSGDAGNATVTGPTSVAPLEEFDIRLLWDFDDLAIGDTVYGTITLGSDASDPANIGIIPVTLTRGVDDVSFVASTDVAEPTETISFLSEVIPNLTSEDRTYQVTASIPAGLTVVDGSVSAGGEVVGDEIVWTLPMPSLADAEPSYTVVTSEEDAACAMPFATNGGYTDLELFGIFPDLTVEGDTVSYSAFSGQNFNFYGRSFVGGLNFTDDGFVYFNSSQGSTPFVNTPIPDSADPNDMIAMLWRDMVIPTPDATPGSVVGVSLASAGTDLTIIEYDDVKMWPGDGDDSIDMAVSITGYADDTPGAYEIVVAFDNVNIDNPFGTMGVENEDGTSGTQFAYNDVAVTSGMAVCYDLVQPVMEAQALSFEATVDASAAGSDVTVSLTSTVDNPGTVAITETATITVEGAPEPTYTGRLFGPLLDNPELPQGELIPARFFLFDENGQRTTKSNVWFGVITADGEKRLYKQGKLLPGPRLFYRNIYAKWLAPGDYILQANVQGEVIDEIPFTIK